MLSAPNDESPANIDAAARPCGRLPDIRAVSWQHRNADFPPESYALAARAHPPLKNRRPAPVPPQKQWREDRDGFKKTVARIVRKSLEC